MEFVQYDIEVMDSILKITPIDGFKDNSIYEIKLLGIKSKSGDVLNKTIKFTTRLKPLYVDVYSVRSLIGDQGISDDVIIYHIREASKFADYIIQSSNGSPVDEDNVPFNVSQFVKYYAAHECLLRHTVEMSSTTGIKGTVGNVSFEDKQTTRDISDLLRHFCKEIDKWKDDLKGYPLEGRARMKATVRGKNATPIYQSLPLGYERSN